jgi:putative ABC transport system permease protein
MLQTIRYTIRSLCRTPSFTLAALICLALGIGATSAIFSVVNAVVLRPLPYPDAAGLVRLYSEFPKFPNGGLPKFAVSDSEVFDLQKARSFQSVGAWSTNSVNLAGLNQPSRVTATFVDSHVPKLLGVKPLLGHFITAQDDTPGAPDVVMLSYGLWKQSFGGDKNIIGKDTRINGNKATVIGVMPSGFVFPPGQTDQTDIWSALQLDPKKTNPAGHNFNVLGRLAPGVTLGQARQEMAGLLAQWGRAGSQNNHVLSPDQHPVTMYPFYDEVVGGVRKSMLLLLGAVIFVLLIACVNVANLLLARSEARQREIAVRRAIGASTFDLIKQFVTEGALLSLAGAALGIAFASASLQFVAAGNSSNIPRASEIQLDTPVLLFTLVVSIIIGVLFGFAPFIHVSAIRVFETLKASGGRASASTASNRFRRSLVIVQMALAFALLAGAGLMVRGFWRLQQVNPGFNPNGLLTFSITLPRVTYKDPQAGEQFWTTLHERLSQAPGAASVALMGSLPPLRQEVDNDTMIEGFVSKKDGPIQNVAFYQIAGDRFFETLGVRLLEGRFLEPRDGTKQAQGVVVNATMARTFWPHQSALGRRLHPGGDPKDPWMTVVGVIADIKNAGVDKPAGSEIFLPYRLSPSASLDVAVRTHGNPLAFAGEARRLVASIDPSLPLAKVQTMDDVVAAATSRPRFLTLILSLFSLLALCLATVGIYGVIAYSVQQRTPEFGIKMALGAAPGQLLRQVVGQGLLLGSVGIAIGFCASLALTTSLEGMLFGVSRLDLSSFATTTVVLLAATAFASLLPALRAMRIQPVSALRYE